jgi:hypothetical protein
MAGHKGLYRIWLQNLSGADRENRWNEAAINEVGDNLKDLFEEVIKHPECPYSSVDWFAYHPDAQLDPGEVLVYFVPSSGHSQIMKFPQLGVSVDFSKDGNTVQMLHGGILSEVYVDKHVGDDHHTLALAKLAFHELMHNKLDAVVDNPLLDDIHKHGGGGLATGPAPIDWYTTLTLPNKMWMARAVARPVPQFTDAGNVSRLFVDGMPEIIGGRIVVGPDNSRPRWFTKKVAPQWLWDKDSGP